MAQTNMAAGHFSQAGVFSQVLEQAERYAFLIWALSACPDGLSGAATEALVLDLIAVFIGMGIILGVSGKIGSCPLDHAAESDSGKFAALTAPAGLVLIARSSARPGSDTSTGFLACGM